MMKRLACLFTILLLAGAWCAPAGALVLTDAPLGNWKVVAHKFSGKSKWGKQYADVYIGQQAVITGSAITFGGETCATSFSRSQVSARTYFKSRYGFAPQALDIRAESVDLVKTSCTIAGFDRLVIEESSYMFIEIQGVFFTLKHQVGN